VPVVAIGEPEPKPKSPKVEWLRGPHYTSDEVKRFARRRRVEDIRKASRKANRKQNRHKNRSPRDRKK
jgi:hypothetical protein